VKGSADAVKRIRKKVEEKLEADAVKGAADRTAIGELAMAITAEARDGEEALEKAAIADVAGEADRAPARQLGVERTHVERHDVDGSAIGESVDQAVCHFPARAGDQYHGPACHVVSSPGPRTSDSCQPRGIRHLRRHAG
jgi:hypothetical protein